MSESDRNPPPAAGSGPAPDVSVLIAAWNAETTLPRAIASALAQTASVEVLVSDDASSDGGLALAERIAARDRRVRVVASARNGGPARARNRALALARGAWVTALDADDAMEPERLDRLLAVARAERADFVADDLFKVDAARMDGPRTRLVSDGPIGRQRLSAAEFISGNLTGRRGARREYGFLKPLISRNFLLKHRLEYPDLRLGEDYALYAEALILGARFVLTDPAGYVAAQTPGSLSHDHPTEAHERLMAADRRLLATPGLDRTTRRALRRHLLDVHKKWQWRRMIDAVREARPRAALACFRSPPPVALDLALRLSREALHRAVGGGRIT